MNTTVQRIEVSHGAAVPKHNNFEAITNGASATIQQNQTTSIDPQILRPHNNLTSVPYAAQVMQVYKDRELDLLNSTNPNTGVIQPIHRDFDNTRRLLVDWMHKISKKMDCPNETIQLAVQIFDRYMHKVAFLTSEAAQVAALTSLYIAAKVEDTYSYSLRQIVSMVGSSISKEQIRLAEVDILNELDWSFFYATPIVFLRVFALVDDMFDRQRYFAFFLSEIALYNRSMNVYTASQVAAACISITKKCFRHPDRWTPALQAASGLSKEQFNECYRELASILTCATKEKYDDIFVKYNNPRLHNVSAIMSKMLGL